MYKKYVCYGCGTKYEEEVRAIKCCMDWIEGKSGEKVVPKQFRKHIQRQITHHCEKMLLKGKQWSCELKKNESCPECGYEWNPR